MGFDVGGSVFAETFFRPEPMSETEGAAMTYEEVLAALDGYNRELVGILSRFKKDQSGIHIQDRDDDTSTTAPTI